MQIFFYKNLCSLLVVARRQIDGYRPLQKVNLTAVGSKDGQLTTFHWENTLTKGDSGGPLFRHDQRDRAVLYGIASAILEPESPHPGVCPLDKSSYKRPPEVALDRETGVDCIQGKAFPTSGPLPWGNRESYLCNLPI
ncbi:hypothetical protein NECAME_08405 [Necator americanus]|uniref:Peptidase S1 domain-containing protein n=1 Tax=Necator americanus TaxID=51031 RepID=W2TKR1_NECAM|nr:hypothetical protein NECAME_08405 [Necator americanus]ETN81607.1 hypothetical protein NECAME_08405 [Necator americanus]